MKSGKEISVLIIGGTGCLSLAVVKEALNVGMQVSVLNRGRRADIIPPNVNLIKADKNDTVKVKALLKNHYFDAVIDFLSYTTVDLERSVRIFSPHARQYFFISSCAVYNPGHNVIYDEDAPKVNPGWSYSKNKWECELLLQKLSEELRFKYTVIRPAITYGDTRIPYGIMPPYGYHGTVIQRILSGKPIITWDNGQHVSNMMRVEDFSRAFVMLIGDSRAYNKEFNICSKEVYSYSQVLDILEKKLNRSIIRYDLPTKIYGELYPQKKEEITAGRTADTKRVMRNFMELHPDFEEKISIEDGIGKTIDAYIRQNYQSGIDWKFDAIHDRIIRTMCGHKAARRKYNIRFVDYLNNASLSDRINYFMTVNEGTLAANILGWIVGAYQKIR